MEDAKPFREKKVFKNFEKETGKIQDYFESQEDVPEDYDSQNRAYSLGTDALTKSELFLSLYMKYEISSAERKTPLFQELLRFKGIITKHKNENYLSTLDMIVNLLFPTMKDEFILKGLNDKLELFFSNNDGSLLDAFCQFAYHGGFLHCQNSFERLEHRKTEKASIKKHYTNTPRWSEIEQHFREINRCEKECEPHSIPKINKLFYRIFKDKIVPILIENAISEEECGKKRPLTDQEKNSIRIKHFKSKNFQRNWKRTYDSWKLHQQNGYDECKPLELAGLRLLWRKRKWAPMW